jgi:hypothetical protein
MPTALRASRDFVARALAQVRSGLSAADRAQGEPGPEIKVEPFDRQNVSTAAGLVKLGTSIAAARRSRANWQEAQRGAELEREKTRASIALLRAQAAYNLGEGRQTGGGAVLTRDVGPYKAGTPISDVNVDLANRRIAASAESQRETAGRSGRVTAAQAALRQIDARVERQAQAGLQGWATGYARNLLARLNSQDPYVQRNALIEAGIDPAQFVAEAGKNPSGSPYYERVSPDQPGTLTEYQRAEVIRNAFKRLQDETLSQARDEAARRVAPLRDRYQNIIDQGAGGFGAAEDPNDPLGLGINPLGLTEEEAP